MAADIPSSRRRRLEERHDHPPLKAMPTVPRPPFLPLWGSPSTPCSITTPRSRTTFLKRSMRAFAWQAHHHLILLFQADFIDWRQAFKRLPVSLTGGTNSTINSVVGGNDFSDFVPLYWKNQGAFSCRHRVAGTRVLHPPRRILLCLQPRAQQHAHTPDRRHHEKCARRRHRVEPRPLELRCRLPGRNSHPPNPLPSAAYSPGSTTTAASRSGRNPSPSRPASSFS